MTKSDEALPYSSAVASPGTTEAAATPAADEVPGLVPILLYHDVSAHAADPFCVDLATFRRHMALVAESGRTPLTVDGYVELLAGRSGPSRPVLVTFDDGYAGFPQVLEAMAEAGVPAATIYVTTGRLDRPGGPTRTELNDLPAWTQVGAHSRTHAQLDLLAPDALADEIAGSKADVEQELSRECSSFAYPHGHHGRRVRAATVAAGYTSAAAVKNALSHPADDPFALARVTITRETTDDLLRDLLRGRGAPRAWRRERLRTKAYRAYRRHRGASVSHE